MAVTVRHAVYYPVVGTVIAPLETQFATMAASVETALNNGVVKREASQAARDTDFPAPVQGDRVWRNDLGYGETYYGAYNVTTNPGGKATAGWYSNAPSGMVPVRPTSVSGTGASINPDGTVIFGNTGNNVIVNGVFTNAFSKYKVVAYWVTTAPNGAVLQVSNAGSPLTAASYLDQYQYINGSAGATALVSGTTQFSGAFGAANEHAAEWTVLNPADSARSTIFMRQTADIGVGHATSSGSYNVATAVDGFRLGLSTTGSGQTWASGYLTVYGMS